ncbi:hypothetical protein EJB05_11634, partial [Eragrostis curvula]
METTRSSMSAPSGKTSAPVTAFIAVWVYDEEGHQIVRTMRPTDKLQDLMDFYYAMVTDVPRGKGVFLYKRKRVYGEETPADYGMNSSDEIEFLLDMGPDMFITLTVEDDDGRKVTSTMRRRDKLQVLMDFYFSMVSSTPNKGIFKYADVEVLGWKTPADYEMEDEDRIDFCSELKTGKPLTLTVSDCDGRRIARTIRSTDKLQVLIDFYHSAVPILGIGGVAFLYDGQQVDLSKTPMDLGLEDGDEIETMIGVPRSYNNLKNNYL